ncbi:MAG: long-chain-fatty-acid--CoA ligase [Acidimicrobiia bacterium]|nr:long-chain-fatty-acid--CoA ligase [Acidimicrobiia bacterium]
MLSCADPLWLAGKVSAGSLAVVCGDHHATFGELADRCRRLGRGLATLGLRPGDRVAVLAANCHRYLEAHLAIPAAGLVVVPLNTRHAEPELRYAVEHSGARVLLTDRDPGSLAGIVEQVVDLPAGYEALLARAGGDGGPGSGIGEDDLAALFYTGGTTGRSKGVMLSHRNLVANSLHTLSATGLDERDRYLIACPLFHVAGTSAVLSALWAGAAQVVVPAFEPRRVLDLVERERVTVTLGVPTMVAALADEQERDPRDVSSLRLLAHAGAPIAMDVLRRAHRAFPGCRLDHYYGATETAPMATALCHEERMLDRPRGRSCGQPAPGVEVRVVDPTGREVAPGQVGEVVVRGPNVMLGYWRDPEQTRLALRDGWYHTGDLGHRDREGFLFLVDRLKDMIVTGGENVYSTEVEDVLHGHPEVVEAAVFGVPDGRWGEAVHAVVVARGDVAPGELIAHCREHLAGYKVPKAVELRREPLPRSGPGKVLKRVLREPYWAGHETRIV